MPDATPPQTQTPDQPPAQHPAAAAPGGVNPPPRPPRRNPKLSRDDMVKIIKEGGSVLLNGQHVSRESQLPTAEDLAADDEQAKAELADGVAAQIAFLTKQHARLTGADAKAADKAGDKPADKAAPAAAKP